MPSQALHTVFKAACASAAVIGHGWRPMRAQAADAANGKALSEEPQLRGLPRSEPDQAGEPGVSEARGPAR